jgi:drug/metabolite transporter (DMT)-like permease
LLGTPQKKSHYPGAHAAATSSPVATIKPRSKTSQKTSGKNHLSMKNLLFYTATVMIWGSTWLGIKLQLGTVAPLASVAYRFSLAALILFGWCLARRLNMRFSLAEHCYIALQGMLLFGFNYLFFYLAEQYITSGLAAVIFSLILLMNIVNGAILLGSRIDGVVLAGGLLGLVGIGLVFNPEISAFTFDNAGVKGMLLCVLATLLASLGNIASARNQHHKLPIVQTNAFGMAYGAVAVAMVALVSGTPFTFDPSPVYIGSLLYLALFGSVIAFGCYLTLVGNIGADRAAYATLLFPIVALIISAIWEDYRFTTSALIGIGLIILGNLAILKRRQLASDALPESRPLLPWRAWLHALRVVLVRK